MRRAIALFTLVIFSCFGTVAEGQQDDFIQVAKKAIPAVVSIRVKAIPDSASYDQSGQDPMEFFGDEFFQHFFGGRRTPRRQEPQIGQGSGFIVTPDGYILTNSHVIHNAQEIVVYLDDGREYHGRLIGEDDSTDLALVKIDGEDLPYVELGNSDDLEVGQWVVAIGTPLGLQATLTAGVVSAKGRNNLDLANIEDFIQTDVAINRGNSGGPLLNLDAKVVGINTAIVANGGVGGYMGIGFAIPSNMAQRVMEQLVTNGKVSRGFMGVALQGIDQDLAQAFGLSKVEGALVAEVSLDSPAEHAGLKQGDIILSYQGKSVPNIAALRNAVAMMEPGTKLVLNVLRDGETVEVVVDLGSHPGIGEPSETSRSFLGFQVEALTPEIAQTLGLTNEKGVVVNFVEPGSAAHFAGLKKGALVLALNKQSVATVEEFNGVLEGLDPEKPVLLLVKQGELTRFISLRVQPEAVR